MNAVNTVLRFGGSWLICFAFFACPALTLAQGQDSTPTKRNIQVVAELLARVYDNYIQVYFDRRLGCPESERHGRLEMRVDRIDGPAPCCLPTGNSLTETIHG